MIDVSLTPFKATYRDSWSQGLNGFIDALSPDEGRLVSLLWQPNPDKDGVPNPQRLALESEADELLFGGQAGGGKTDLLIGLAATRHQRSVIFRRVFPNLRAVIERSREVFNPTDDPHIKDSYNESLHRWSLGGRRMLEFGAVQFEKDKGNWRGRPHDLKGFDELPEFTKSQYHFIIGWNRTTDPGQRCRVVATCNPPDTDEGQWIVEAWGPWLDDQFPDPAKPGELRWYFHDTNEKIVWLKSGEPVEVNGETIIPRSRTFIPSSLADNPYLSGDNTYRSVLQSLPEPLRSQLLKGDFKAGTKANLWQVLPTAWVRLAQKRWLERERPNTPLSATGIDAVRGGQDKLTIANRYDNYFDEVYSVPGIQVEDGPALAAIVFQYLDGKAPAQYMNIDVIGVGSSGYDALKIMYPNVYPVNASAGSDVRDRSGKLKMRNCRAEYYWRMREALDPANGDDLALPPGNEIVADLCAATWKNTAAGVQIEDKEEIKKRLGRSPDTGEAILMCHFEPPKFSIGFF